MNQTGSDVVPAMKDNLSCVAEIAYCVENLHIMTYAISGTFFLCAAPPDSNHFAGLTDQQVKTYMEWFAMPEMFLNVGSELFVLPYLYVYR